MYKLNYFNFKENKDNYLLTNDLGKYIFIDKDEFKKIISRQELSESIKEELLEKGFIYDVDEELFSIDLATKLRKIKAHLFTPTVLHI